MRKSILIAFVAATMLNTPLYAERKTIDLHDYDDDLMRDLDKTIKYFEPDITAGNAQSALDDAAVLQDGFKYTEDYFAKKGGADDAVTISRQGQEALAAAVKLVADSNFEGAAAAARQTAQTCRSCHDIYKPLTK
ncbi:hypothetical protein [Methylocapsa palsarum]|uniref:Cytochrome C n=1 Tax=Methylocapsa palsarum TaxID=1612308 RepID=A0A1I3VYP8_9HYPH|nr:hypothetical protein [Methylocapsa palsarum]SFK00249.1 hypothetical protein SAMN05444581_101205 [Methylocapsa palsarum]